MTVLLDTNVMVDALQRREPWFSDAAAIIRAVAAGEIEGYLTAKQIADLHYFARKQFKGEENVDAKARRVIGSLMALFQIIDTLNVDCQNAMVIENGDYEDAMLIACAVRSGIDCIVTRNPDHFKPSPVRICSPSEFAQALQ